MAKYPPRSSITAEKLLVCEGVTDEAFFRALIAARKLQTFCIRTTADSGGAGGNSGFAHFLTGLPTWPNFYQLQHIVIVADNDDDPTRSFDRVRAQVAQAQPAAIPRVSYGVPAQPQQSAPGTPAAVTVLMLPWTGIVGNLEALCLEAVSHAHLAAAECVNRFAECSGVNAWSINAQSKMKMCTFLAGKNHQNPSLGLGNVWRDNPGLIPVDDGCFDEIADFLASIQGA
jgi:hypothetical protein